ncbi:DUF551 domain-containing protein [Salmonella enterica]|nr:DUF551 domain-containing protein [Salmonella enterica]ECS8522669.1 DUF551 domain-containing protein [Salmonella enterica subsp. enterica serovar Bareilly]ECO2495476.1 DUF551 domain-containing protein [Salmonella enterica]ECR0396961.1 DUF551 domain-containing protein [Salmonella enterica]EDG8262390.1 DUF551 domain-containing protein [Salmonella enterica subsp. enterica serovar Bareilly]
MTTITREQQKQILIDTANHVISRDNTSPYSENLRELARIALAALEADPEPVVPEYISVRQAISALESADCVTTIGQAYKMGWNACRAAMLQGGQPVSNHDELPYAQVKAVADLYALCWQSGEVVTYTPAPEKATIWLNNYSGTCVQEYVKLERLQEALAGNSPVTPGCWISCSERMPDDKQYVWFFGESRGFAGRDTLEGYYDWSRNKWWAVTYIGEEPASKVTHWMPLPEPPQEEK